MSDLTIGDLLEEYPLVGNPAADDGLAMWDESAAATVGVTVDQIQTKISDDLLDADGTLAADSDAVAATQKATKTYVDEAVAGPSTITGQKIFANDVFIENNKSLEFQAAAGGNANSFKSGTDNTFLFDVGANNNVKIKGTDGGGTKLSYTDGSFTDKWSVNSAGETLQNGKADLNGHKAVNVADPTSAQDAATKTYVDTGLAAKQASLGFTAEDSANKSTSDTLGASDTLFPTQHAVKTYVDTGLAAKQASLGFTAEDSANKSTSTALGISDTLYPTQKAVKTYVDAATSGGGGVAHVGYEAMMLSQCGDVVPAAQVAYYQTMFANTPIVFNRMTGLCLEYAGSANVLELGIYSAAGTKIDSGTVSLGAAGFFTCNMSGDVTLTPGTKYILALLNRANDTTKKFAAFDPYPVNTLLNAKELSRTTLPSTATLTTGAGFAFYLSLWHS